MRLLILSIAIAVSAFTYRAAYACDPVRFDTPYDFHDQATTVVLVKVDKLAGSTASLTVVDTFKGNAGTHLTIAVDLKSTCSPDMKAGQLGVIFLDKDNHMLGLYSCVQRQPAVIQELRGFSANAT